MLIDLDSAARVCLTCRGRFGSVDEAREAYRALGALPTDEADSMAKRLQVASLTFRGVIVVSRHASIALDWLEYHQRPLTKFELRKLRAEFEGAHPVREVLAWELQNGAREVLRSVDWQPVAC
jgi:hypothetical protein